MAESTEAPAHGPCGGDTPGGPDHNDVLVYLNHIPVGSGKVENANGVWHHVRVEIRGSYFRVSVDGKKVTDM